MTWGETSEPLAVTLPPPWRSLHGEKHWHGALLHVFPPPHVNLFFLIFPHSLTFSSRHAVFTSVVSQHPTVNFNRFPSFSPKKSPPWRVVSKVVQFRSGAPMFIWPRLSTVKTKRGAVCVRTTHQPLRTCCIVSAPIIFKQPLRLDCLLHYITKIIFVIHAEYMQWILYIFVFLLIV